MSNAVVERFSLENGGEYLGASSRMSTCSAITMLYKLATHSRLLTTFSQNARWQGIGADWETRFSAFVQQRLAQHGAIHITESSGVFHLLPVNFIRR